MSKKDSRPLGCPQIVVVLTGHWREQRAGAIGIRIGASLHVADRVVVVAVDDESRDDLFNLKTVPDTFSLSELQPSTAISSRK